MTVISTDEAIKALRAEALRLLNNQKQLLQRVSDEVASVDQEDGGGEYTVEGIRKKILSLEENKKLLEKMEMVLVVVGTMKAGKSTCINAIVGREVLPSRNRPMTALPTLIRHKKGVVVPKLYFSQSKQQPLQELLSNIKSKLLNQDLEAIENVKGDDVLKKLALEIQNGWSLSEHFEGETEIFEFLSAINDLVRLSKALNIEFPFNEYSGVDDYPVIEVEFTHFKDAANDELTNFSILDTPGFNEAGQEKNLKPMLQNQLENAHAVLAVLDYTQLQSQSDAELRYELEQIAEKTQDRLFVLINKFDAVNSRGLDAEAVRAFASDSLLKDFLDPQDAEMKVFPVSGLRAYLAKRAENEIDDLIAWAEQGCIEKNWRDDFSKIAFGEDYDAEDLCDKKRVLSKASKMWKNSLFDYPLSNVIAHVKKNAAFMLLSSAVFDIEKIISGSAGKSQYDGIDKMLEVRMEALRSDKENIKKVLDGLRVKTQNVERKRDKFSNNWLSGLIDEAYREILPKNSPIYLEVEKILADTMASWKRDKLVEIQGSDFIFENEALARKKLDELEKKIKDFLEGYERRMNVVIETNNKKVVVKFEELRTELTSEFKDFNEAAKLSGLSQIEMKFGRLEKHSIHTQELELLNVNLVEVSNPEKKKVKEGGVWGTFKRTLDVFGAFGWGEYEIVTQIKKYKLSAEDINSQVAVKLVAYDDARKDLLASKFRFPLERKAHEFFAQVNHSLNLIKEHLQSSLENHEENAEKKEEIISDLMGLKGDYEDSLEDLKNLSSGIKSFDMAKGVQ